METYGLEKYGITGIKEVVYNPTFEQLFEAEMDPTLEGYEKGQMTELGAVNVMTGIYTGRSPKDKFIVMDENSKDTVWWTSDEFKNDNKPASQEAWEACKKLAIEELSNKKLYVMDVFCGTNKDTRMAIRFIMEVAWQAHFVKNMFIQPTEEELKNFKPDFISYNASKAKLTNYKELGLNSETAAIFNITSREQVIINTWYGGEMKKGMFSMMNYYLPLKGIASMHCSANTDMNGATRACLTSRAAATPRSSTWTRTPSPTSTTPFAATPCWRMSPWTPRARSTSPTSLSPRTPASATPSTTSRRSCGPSPGVLPPRT